MLYIVKIAVDRERAEQWEAWMRDHHIPEVMDTGYFRHGIMARDEATDSEARRGYRILYQAHSEALFHKYQEEYAEELQQEHTERYRGAFEASRELLPVIKEFS